MFVVKFEVSAEIHTASLYFVCGSFWCSSLARVAHLPPPWFMLDLLTAKVGRNVPSSTTTIAGGSSSSCSCDKPASL